MKPNRRAITLFSFGIIILLLAAACGGTTGDEAAEPTVVAEPVEATAEREPAEEPDSQVPAPGDSNDQAAGAISLTWTTEQVGEGIKPAVAVDLAGVAHIAYLTEEMSGAVYYANNSTGSFDVEQISEGYFYGPVDIALGPGGTPHIAYHDHQATGFDPNLGDEVVAVLTGGSWELITVEDVGHDGWDNSIAVDAEGNWHTAAVDPAQFGGTTAVEYATSAGTAPNPRPGACAGRPLHPIDS